MRELLVPVRDSSSMNNLRLLEHYESVVAFLSWKVECDPFNLKLRVERMEAEYKLDTLKAKL